MSFVGKAFLADEPAVGFYADGPRIKTWGGTGAFWGGIWALLLPPALFVLPGVGAVALAGPVVAALIGALEGALPVAGVSALGAVLMEFGLRGDQVVAHESALRDDQYVLIVHGDATDRAQADWVLAGVAAWEAA